MRTPRLSRIALVVLALSLLAGPAALAADPTASGEKKRSAGIPAKAHAAFDSSGPLTTIDVSAQLQCNVVHQDEAVGVFDTDDQCGTWVAVGPLYADEPVVYGPFETASPQGFPYTVIDQSGWTGSGTASDPARLKTVLALGKTGLRLTQVDSYVTGGESYRTTITLQNFGKKAQDVRLYRMGRCMPPVIQRGLADSPAGAIACRYPSGSPTPDRITQWTPLTEGSTRLLGTWTLAYTRIGFGEPFENFCDCVTPDLKSGGLNWTLTLQPYSSHTFVSLLTVSPSGASPAFAAAPEPLIPAPKRPGDRAARKPTETTPVTGPPQPCGALTNRPRC